MPSRYEPGQHLLRNGVHVRAELAERHAAVLRHHPRAVQVPQALVRVRLRACPALSLAACEDTARDGAQGRWQAVRRLAEETAVARGVQTPRSFGHRGPWVHAVYAAHAGSAWQCVAQSARAHTAMRMLPLYV